jgi:Tfp pilus assembly protein PilF
MPPLLRFALAFMLPFCSATSVSAAAYLPKSDATVLERLPFKANDVLARELTKLRTELRSNPRNLQAAIELAQRYYALVAEEGDPRFLGYAEAALAPWWDLPEPPIEVQVLRAGLAQFRHDFPAALNDLSSVLAREPRHAQARALRAIIQIVQARYALARADCLALHGVSSALIAVGCVAMVDGLTGKAASAYASLSAELARSKNASAEEKLWVQIRLAEISQRLGHMEVAEIHYRQGLALGIADTFLLAAYADFLLEQKRPDEVVALLKDKIRSDTLLLRLAFAERALGLSTAHQRESTLAARYSAAQLRGDTVHQQEEARFALQVQHDAAKALKLAQENWKVQREPRDARIFLEAALAKKNPAAAQPVLQWLTESRIEERALSSLGQQLVALNGKQNGAKK